MGGLMVESSSGATYTEEIFVENDLKDNKKKKRRSRKSKQTLSACSSASEICTDATISVVDNSSYHVVPHGHHQQDCNTSSHHLIPNGQQLPPKEYRNSNEQLTHGGLQNHQPVPHEIKEALFSDSVHESAGNSVENHYRRTYFPPHWSSETVSKALEKGDLLKALFRVNAHNRVEAYCKIDGVQTDVLISGVVAQNRAIEGDTVAIVIDPPSLWPRMKGSQETLDTSAFENNRHEALKQDSSKGKSKLDVESDYAFSPCRTVCPQDGACYENSSSGAMFDSIYVNGVLDNGDVNICEPPSDSMTSLERLCTLVSSFPSKRPTGRVVAITDKSARRDNVVGFLSVKQWICTQQNKKKNFRKNKNQSDLNNGYVLVTPTDPKFTKMMVQIRNLPESIKKRLENSDSTVESDLIGAQIVDWSEDSYIPDASVIQVFGRGSEVEAQIAAILFQNAIDASEFSSGVLSCLPQIPWEVPNEELQSRRDLRNSCIFTIDPSTATDLDDALSVERLKNGVYRVGVHIADVSYFVKPDAALDIDAQIRSTTVYLLKSKLPMLPPILSDNLASLNPAVDRLAFSIFWDINSSGEILDHWIGRTVIRSCIKLSYEHAQEMIIQDSNWTVEKWPKLYGQFQWSDVVNSVKSLNEISKLLRENRFKDGALSLESPKVVFLFDEEGVPYDSTVSGRMESNFLVEEFMLLANKTAAEVITRAYPSCALLRRHPEPNARKLREFESFCRKHGLKLNISSSLHLHQSLETIRGELKNDSVLLDILMSYAARPMQLASYFCSGESKEMSDFSHYSLAVPLYTHFTSPLRRYPDIVVHRTLAAALEAEDIYLRKKRMLLKITEEETLSRCFTGVSFNKDEIESVEGKEALATAAAKYMVLGSETLADVAAHCNERKLATRHVKDATNKLYMWVLLRNKEIIYSDARVLGLGPKFMSIYITKLAMERRIYYDEVEGLSAEWLDATSTLVLTQSMHKRSNRRSSPGKWKSLEEAALIVSPADLDPETNLPQHREGDNGESQICGGISDISNNEPAFFPLTVNLLSTIPVALHAVGGDDGPLDIVARLYLCSYLL